MPGHSWVRQPRRHQGRGRRKHPRSDRALPGSARRKGPSSDHRDPADRSGHLDAPLPALNGREVVRAFVAEIPRRRSRAIGLPSTTFERAWTPLPVPRTNGWVAEGGWPVLRTIKALIEADGAIRLLEPVSLGGLGRRCRCRGRRRRHAVVHHRLRRQRLRERPADPYPESGRIRLSRTEPSFKR